MESKNPVFLLIPIWTDFLFPESVSCFSFSYFANWSCNVLSVLWMQISGTLFRPNIVGTSVQPRWKIPQLNVIDVIHSTYNI